MTQRLDGPRIAVIGTTTMAPHAEANPGDLLAEGLALVDEMARRAESKGWSLDLAVLPETFAQVAEQQDWSGVDQAVDGPIVSALAEKARAYQSYVTVPLRMREGREVYNSLIILDRRGEPAGIYRKVFVTVSRDGSLEGGVKPGVEFPVFDLDFGRVGVQICYDVFFENGWQAYDDQDAELVVFSSATPLVMALKSYAFRHQYYVVSSVHEVPSVIVDPIGRELALGTTADRDPILARVDLDYRVVRWSSLKDYGKALGEKYGDRIDQDWHYEEHMCLLTSRDPSLPVREVMDRERLGTHREDLLATVPLQEAAAVYRLRAARLGSATPSGIG